LLQHLNPQNKLAFAGVGGLSIGKQVLENLTNLDQLPPKDITLMIGILRLRGGSGSPASVLALF
jgi:kynurenine formamidase